MLDGNIALDTISSCALPPRLGMTLEAPLRVRDAEVRLTLFSSYGGSLLSHSVVQPVSDPVAAPLVWEGCAGKACQFQPPTRNLGCPLPVPGIWRPPLLIGKDYRGPVSTETVKSGTMSRRRPQRLTRSPSVAIRQRHRVRMKRSGSMLFKLVNVSPVGIFGWPSGSYNDSEARGSIMVKLVHAGISPNGIRFAASISDMSATAQQYELRLMS